MRTPQSVSDAVVDMVHACAPTACLRFGRHLRGWQVRSRDSFNQSLESSRIDALYALRHQAMHLYLINETDIARAIGALLSHVGVVVDRMY
jgi:hypothetical protein